MKHTISSYYAAAPTNANPDADHFLNLRKR